MLQGCFQVRNARHNLRRHSHPSAEPGRGKRVPHKSWRLLTQKYNYSWIRVQKNGQINHFWSIFKQSCGLTFALHQLEAYLWDEWFSMQIKKPWNGKHIVYIGFLDSVCKLSNLLLTRDYLSEQFIENKLPAKPSIGTYTIMSIKEPLHKYALYKHCSHWASAVHQFKGYLWDDSGIQGFTFVLKTGCCVGQPISN